MTPNELTRLDRTPTVNEVLRAAIWYRQVVDFDHVDETAHTIVAMLNEHGYQIIQR